MSNAATMEKLTIDNFARDEFDALQTYFDAHGCDESDGDTGTVTIHDVPVNYAYSPDAKQLKMTITSPSKRVTPAKIRTLLSRLRDFNRKEEMGGHYNHVYATINNELDHTVVIYSEDMIDNGDLGIDSHRIKGGEKTRAFHAQSSTLSGIGCQGQVIYSFADGNTQLTISYKLNGEGIHSFNVGVRGTNAQRYDVTASNTGANYDCEKAVTEMKPTVTIKSVKP